MDDIQLEAFTGQAGTVIRLNGRLDGNTAPALNEYFNVNIQNLNKPILLDFEKVTFISSAGLRVLLGLAKRVQKGNSTITLVSVQALVQEVLEISGFSSLFKHRKSLPDALSALGFAEDFCRQDS